MNLSELKQQIKASTDYAPSNPAYDRDLERIINDAYRSLWNAHTWTFATKTAYLDVHPDLTNDLITTIENYGYDTDLIAPVAGACYFYLTNASGSALLKELWLGNILEADGVEYTIVHIDSVDEDVDNDIEVRIYVDQPVRAAKTVTDWRIKQRYLALPRDCVDVFGVAYRPWPFTGTSTIWKTLTAVDRYTDARAAFALDDDTASDAYAYVREADFTVPGAGKMSYVVTDTTGTSTNGNFADGFACELAWAWLGKHNRPGPLSEPLEVYLTDGNTTSSITLSLLNRDGSATHSPAYENPDLFPYGDELLGLRRAIFINLNYDATNRRRLGPPCWMQVPLGAFVTTDYPGTGDYQEFRSHQPYVERPADVTVVLRNSIYLQQRWAKPDSYYLDRGGRYQRIRLYPRPSGYDKLLANLGTPENPSSTAGVSLEPAALQRLELTYRYQPPDLCFDQDSPHLPAEFHQTLLYKALTAVYLKNGNLQLSAMYEQKYQQDLKNLMRRHAVFNDVFHRKGRSDVPGVSMERWWTTGQQVVKS